MIGRVFKIKSKIKIGPQLLFNDSSSLEIIIIIKFWPNVVFLHTLKLFLHISSGEILLSKTHLTLKPNTCSKVVLKGTFIQNNYLIDPSSNNIPENLDQSNVNPKPQRIQRYTEKQTKLVCRAI